MKTSVIFLLLLFLVTPIASADQKIKQFTVSDYLQKEKAKADKQGRKANRLIYETNPYLLQHAYNPVDWYAWGPEAFEKAKKENKPIFLSIGYSTCHWCHVMAHESFENEKIAALLNKYFVCIKVDREQRPDIDTVYMSATRLVNGHGGWPMSVFLDQQLRPFHAATYYPPFATENRDGLNEVLLKIQSLWSTQPELINQVASNITERITATADETTEASSLLVNIDDLAMRQITGSFDTEWGGFSAAPKFPRPGIFAYLNQQSLFESEKQFGSQKMMEATLDAMAAGGIYDQVAGGFHRYSVDESWQVPHFEKMLYSQALMVMAYSDYYRINPKESYRDVVFETLKFVRQEMRSPRNGFYSALDADSERADKPGVHTEGAYYLWSESELKSILSRDEFKLVKEYFNVYSEGNIYSDPQQEFTNLNIFYIAEQFRGVVLSKKQKRTLGLIKRKLNAKRYSRPRPHLDDKIITAWNGMMLAAYAKASMVFKQPDFLQSAIQSVKFIEENLYDKKSKKLFRQHRLDKSSSEATLSDYVWLIYGLLEVYQAGSDKQNLVWAKILQAKQDVLFLDKKTGTYYESAANDSSVLFRSKSVFDGALPSANAIALSNLRRLSRLTDMAEQKRFLSQANSLVHSFASVVNQNPAAASMLLSVEFFDGAR